MFAISKLVYQVIFFISVKVIFLYFGIIKNIYLLSTFCIDILKSKSFFISWIYLVNQVLSLSSIRGGEKVTTCTFKAFAKSKI